MIVIKKLTIAVIQLFVFFPSYVFCNEDVPKSYYVKPIEAVCEYPFNDTTKWAITCRIWGLLKYFHPNVTAGKLDWDKVLINSLSKINEAITSEQVNAELTQMIQIAGEHEGQTDHTWNDSLSMNVNLCWLDHSFINDSIRQSLREIASLTTNTHSFYIKPSEGQNILTPNEKNYDSNLISKFEYRLLSLFRYWNVIYYFFPYKYLMDKSWDVTLLEFIPEFLIANDIYSYHKVVRQLSTRMNDGHGFSTAYVDYFYDTSKIKYITLIDSSIVIRNPPEGSLLERGDIILDIDGENINSLRGSVLSFTPSSNKRYADNGINGFIYYSIMKGCKLTVMRNHQMITINEYRKLYPDIALDSTAYHTISPNIGYLNLDFLKSADISDIMNSIKDYKGVILDLRNYPKHFHPWDLLLYLTETQEYNYALATFPDWSHPGAFYKYECKAKFPDELRQGREKYTGKIAVLINERTMSGAETWAMTFRIHGITLIGTPTAGANGTVSSFFLPGGIQATYTAVGFYFPDGTQMQRTGIIPDIEVYPTMDDIIAGRDEILEAAIKYLNSN